MSSLTVTTSAAAPASLDVDVVVIAARAGKDGPELVAHPDLHGHLPSPTAHREAETAKAHRG